MKKKVKRIAIIGLGLIGGSLALSLSKHGYEIIGITRNLSTLKHAKKIKAISKGYTNLTTKSLEMVDIVFIATPLSLITEYIKKISKLAKHDLILTDVGSTKASICKTAKALKSNITFIGGHPMAGTEHSGFAAAQKELFKNCAWILTPAKTSDKSKPAVKILSNILNKTGAKLILTSPEKHDKAVALISHLPIVTSFALCQSVNKLHNAETKRLAMTFASSGFRDTTRVAAGNPEMNHSILKLNISEISNFLPVYIQELQNTIKLLKKDPRKLMTDLENIQNWRKKLYNSTGKNCLLNKS